jgi:predicted transposase YbfD/YdcC
VEWLPPQKDWTGLKSVAMTRNAIKKGETETVETRYYISSLAVNVKEIAGAIRGHRMVESYHWHLEVTFREDDNKTLDKQAAFNMNITRKLVLTVLKIINVSARPLSMRKKRFAIGTNPEKHLESILRL